MNWHAFYQSLGNSCVVLAVALVLLVVLGTDDDDDEPKSHRELGIILLCLIAGAVGFNALAALIK